MSNSSVDNKKDSLRGHLLFFLALLVICLVLNAGFVILFEYYTISTSGGRIIFSISMSWQIILFVIEMITIILQLISVIHFLKKPEEKYCKMSLYAGITAALFALAAEVVMLFTQGLVAASTIFFAVYVLLIIILRTFMLNKVLSGA